MSELVKNHPKNPANQPFNIKNVRHSKKLKGKLMGKRK